MSITFYITATEGESERCSCAQRWSDDYLSAEEAGEEPPAMYSCRVCADDINMSNASAHQLMNWIGVDPEPYGCLPARELAELLNARLRLSDVDAGSYLYKRCYQLLELCNQAGERWISWE